MNGRGLSDPSLGEESNRLRPRDPDDPNRPVPGRGRNRDNSIVVMEAPSGAEGCYSRLHTFGSTSDGPHTPALATGEARWLARPDRLDSRVERAVGAGGGGAGVGAAGCAARA